MVKKLFYGSDEIRLDENQNLDALILSIQKAGESGDGGWIKFGSGNTEHQVRVGPGIPIRVESTAAVRPPPITH